MNYFYSSNINLLSEDNWREIIMCLTNDTQTVYNMSCVFLSVSQVFISDIAKTIVVRSNSYISDEVYYFFDNLQVTKELVEEIEEDNKGGAKTFCNGKLHSFFGQPSLKTSRENPEVEIWHKYGVVHRRLLPALINKRTKVMEWRENGLLHNEHGPALQIDGFIGDKYETTDESHLYQEWRIEGVLTRHEEKGPAIIDIANGIQKWYLNGVLTRAQRGNIIQE